MFAYWSHFGTKPGNLYIVRPSAGILILFSTTDFGNDDVVSKMKIRKFFFVINAPITQAQRRWVFPWLSKLGKTNRTYRPKKWQLCLPLTSNLHWHPLLISNHLFPLALARTTNSDWHHGLRQKIYPIYTFYQCKSTFVTVIYHWFSDSPPDPSCSFIGFHLTVVKLSACENLTASGSRGLPRSILAFQSRLDVSWCLVVSAIAWSSSG